ncbi:hypothetical protein MJO28_010154 [Puccinia striiformis f. sp. tritici]|uniref:Uncharacterized protein n=1 Tax=Puccinia striiformis f. sp. tritici TaxID=168172 RepID=A0ACC0E3Q7_9BASI|nr:hypothetical protein MJO28_010154 [Puccinia striiformis f. sp. tritici]KAI7948231.1 hypothetical protein MJO29_009896 [Puccinia striiformis f. sp. tritici]
MFRDTNTPSPKAKSRFFTTLRRSLRSNSQLTSVPESLFDPPVSTALSDFEYCTRLLIFLPFCFQKTLFKAAPESVNHMEMSSPSAASASSSHPSTPASNTPPRQLTPPQRRHASSFNKITFGTANFLEDRYIYSHSPEKLCLSHDTLSDDNLSTDGFAPRAPFFSIPATRQPLANKTRDIPLYRRPPTVKTHSSSSKKPLRAPFYEDLDEPSDLLPEFNFNEEEFYRDRAAQLAALAAAGPVSYKDPYCSNPYPSELGSDDSPTLGYLSEFPTPPNQSSSPKSNNTKIEKTQPSRSRIIDPASLIIPCDLNYLSSILDTPPPIPQETFVDSLVGMAY